MSRSKLLAFIFSVVFLASSVVLPAMRVKADSNEPIIFSSGLTVYSPVSTVYNSYSVFCNATLRVPYGYQSSLIYSIDGKVQNDSNFVLKFGTAGKYRLEGFLCYHL
jgi:hypothetical protein